MVNMQGGGGEPERRRSKGSLCKRDPISGMPCLAKAPDAEALGTGDIGRKTLVPIALSQQHRVLALHNDIIIIFISRII